MSVFSGQATLTNLTVNNTIIAPAGLQLSSGGGNTGLLSFSSGNFYLNTGSGNTPLYGGGLTVASGDSNVVISNSTSSGVTTSTFSLSTSVTVGNVYSNQLILPGASYLNGSLQSSSALYVKGGGYTQCVRYNNELQDPGNSINMDGVEVYGFQGVRLTSGVNGMYAKVTPLGFCVNKLLASQALDINGSGVISGSLNSASLTTTGNITSSAGNLVANSLSPYSGTAVSIGSNTITFTDTNHGVGYITGSGATLYGLNFVTLMTTTSSNKNVLYAHSTGRVSINPAAAEGTPTEVLTVNGGILLASAAQSSPVAGTIDYKNSKTNLYSDLSISNGNVQFAFGTNSGAGCLRYNANALGVGMEFSSGTAWSSVVGGASSSPVSQGFNQVGSPITGTSSSTAHLGYSIAISADGTTAAVGAPADGSGVGCAIVYILSGGTFVQQGAKLVGTSNVGNSAQGTSVALSLDGNSLAVGAPSDNSGAGAVWLYTRSGTTWTQILKVTSSGSTSFGTSVLLTGNAINPYCYLFVTSTNQYYYSQWNGGTYTASPYATGYASVNSACLAGDRIGSRHAYYTPANNSIVVENSFGAYGTTGVTNYATISFSALSISLSTVTCISISNNASVILCCNPTQGGTTGVVYSIYDSGGLGNYVNAANVGISTTYFGESVCITDGGEIAYIGSNNPALTGQHNPIYIFQMTSGGSFANSSNTLASGQTTSLGSLGFSLAYGNGVLLAGIPLDKTGAGTFAYFTALTNYITLTDGLLMNSLLDCNNGLSIESLYNKLEAGSSTYLKKRIAKKSARLTISSNGTTRTVAFTVGQFSRNGFTTTVGASDHYTVDLNFTYPYANDYVISAVAETSVGSTTYYNVVITNRSTNGFSVRFLSGSTAINLDTTSITAGTLLVNLMCEGY